MPITKETIVHLPNLTERLEGVKVFYEGAIYGMLETDKAENIPVVEIAEVVRHYNPHLCDTRLYYVAGICRDEFLVVADSRITEDNTLCVPRLLNFSEFDIYKCIKVEDHND